jgi:transcriptional regulator with GAF, ATPase, and Fis domain
MATPAVSRESPRAYRERQSLLLRIWEVASSQPSVEGLLAAVADILVEVVPFTAATLICFGPEGPRVCGTHITKKPRVVPGDRARVGRRAEIAVRGARDRIPSVFSNLQGMMISGKPFSCTDLLAKQAWHEHEFHLAGLGTRAYALQPLIVCQEIVGAAIFSRTEPESFTFEQLTIFRAISPAIAAALKNAFQKQKAAARIEALETEIHKLRQKIPVFNDDGNESGISHSADIEDELLYLRDRMLDAEPKAVQDLNGAQSRAYSDLDARLQDEERKLIESTLAATHGRVSGPKGAAVRLGLRASTLEFRIRRLGIDKFQFRRNCLKQESA